MSRDSCFMQTQAVMAPLKVGGRALNSNGVLLVSGWTRLKKASENHQ